jgi:hypothetical protein
MVIRGTAERLISSGGLDCGPRPLFITRTVPHQSSFTYLSYTSQKSQSDCLYPQASKSFRPPFPDLDGLPLQWTDGEPCCVATDCTKCLVKLSGHLATVIKSAENPKADNLPWSFRPHQAIPRQQDGFSSNEWISRKISGTPEAQRPGGKRSRSDNRAYYRPILGPTEPCPCSQRDAPSP